MNNLDKHTGECSNNHEPDYFHGSCSSPDLPKSLLTVVVLMSKSLSLSFSKWCLITCTISTQTYRRFFRADWSSQEVHPRFHSSSLHLHMNGEVWYVWKLPLIRERGCCPISHHHNWASSFYFWLWEGWWLLDASDTFLAIFVVRSFSLLFPLST